MKITALFYPNSLFFSFLNKAGKKHLSTKIEQCRDNTNFHDFLTHRRKKSLVDSVITYYCNYIFLLGSKN